MSATTQGLQIDGLTLSIGQRRILDGVDLDVPLGQVTGLAGESGSGKTMTGMTICGLQPSQAKVGGSIRYTGDQEPIELVGRSEKAFAPIRGAQIAMVFQDPTASMHPMISVEGQLTDHMRHHLGISKSEARTRALDLLARVQVPQPEAALKKYPHQFSGGQLQRIAIASALACEPRLLIADEPTTALDVTVQAGILRLLRSLVDETGIGVVLVTHDLGVMSALADTIAVMRHGRIIEHGSRRQVIQEPQHEYTRALIDALPDHVGAGAHADDITDVDAFSDDPTPAEGERP